MRFTFERPTYEQELSDARTIEAVENALSKIVDLARDFRSPETYGRKLFSPGLDALVPRAARKLRLEDLPSAKSNERVCILSTRFYATGGHSRVATDLIERLQPNGAVVIMTDIYRELRYNGVISGTTNRTFLNERSCLIASSAQLVERIIETYMMLAAIRPTRIVLMCHPMDMVAAVAAWPFRDVVDFIHHVDHVPCIGATVPYSAHIDVTYTCHLACRESGLSPIYAGMAAGTSSRTAPTVSGGKGLRIATCGSLHKFQKRGRYTWTDYAVAALRQPGAELVHIGPTDETFRNEVRRALKAAAISPQRYVFADFQPSLPAELARREVDVYLSSYPETGGKANLEAMAAGVPTIVPVDPDLPPLIEFRLPLPRWIRIGGPGEIPAALAKAASLRASFNDPDQVAALERELARFDAFAEMRSPGPTPDDDRLQ